MFLQISLVYICSARTGYVTGRRNRMAHYVTGRWCWTRDNSTCHRILSSSEKEEFDTYVQRTFPQDAPRSRSAVISEAYGRRVISFRKGNSEYDKHFRHLVKRSGFRLLDFPEAGIRDALVVTVKEDKEVGYLLFISQFCR